jgi:hypothetical protein
MKAHCNLRFFMLGFFYFAIFAAGCKKHEDEITISGRIYDNGFSQYLSGATVKLSGNGVQNGIYSPEFVTLETLITDAGGNFVFKRNKDRSDSFRITVTKDSYFTENYEFSSSVFSSSLTYNLEIKVEPQGQIQVHLYNAYPSDNDDKVVYYFANSDLDCMNCCTNVPHIGLGPAYDTTFTCSFYGNRKIVFLRSVTKDQQTNLYLDSLFCPAFSTETYDIPY